MKDAFTLFKRIVATSFSLCRCKKSIKTKIKENKKSNHSKIWRRFCPQTDFLEKGPFWPIFTISKFSKPEIFVIFGFLLKSFFFWTTKLLLFHQKNFWVRHAKIRKNFDMFGGGWKMDLISPPRKKIVDFARIVVRRFTFLSSTYGRIHPNPEIPGGAL